MVQEGCTDKEEKREERKGEHKPDLPRQRKKRQTNKREQKKASYHPNNQGKKTTGGKL